VRRTPPSRSRCERAHGEQTWPAGGTRHPKACTALPPLLTLLHSQLHTHALPTVLVHRTTHTPPTHHPHTTHTPPPPPPNTARAGSGQAGGAGGWRLVGRWWRRAPAAQHTHVPPASPLSRCLLLASAIDPLSIAQVSRLVELLTNIISDTRGKVEKKQAQVCPRVCLLLMLLTGVIDAVCVLSRSTSACRTRTPKSSL
jgi:hypothetical protein